MKSGAGGGGQRMSQRIVSGMSAAMVKNHEIKVEEIVIKVVPEDDGQDRSQETVRGPEVAEDEKEEEPEQRQQLAASDIQN